MTKKEAKNKITDKIIAAYDLIPEILDKIMKEVTDADLDFKRQVENAHLIRDILDAREKLIPEDGLELTVSDVRDTGNQVHEWLMKLGYTPTLTKETKLYLVQKITELDVMMREITFLFETSSSWVDDWLTYHVEIKKDGTAKFSDLYVTYERLCPKSFLMNKRKFANFLKSLGGIPKVINIDGKATRVYEGLEFKK